MINAPVILGCIHDPSKMTDAIKVSGGWCVCPALELNVQRVPLRKRVAEHKHHAPVLIHQLTPKESELASGVKKTGERQRVCAQLDRRGLFSFHILFLLIVGPEGMSGEVIPMKKAGSITTTIPTSV
jgi:hypothetical protein